MPTAMREIVKKVLAEISRQGIQPTPKVYREIFCSKAKEYGFNVSECDRLSGLATKLSDDERDEIKNRDINDIDSLFDYIVSKLREKEQDMLSSQRSILSEITLEKLASLMIASLVPSYLNSEFNKTINTLTTKITQHPELLKRKEVQIDIEHFIKIRKDIDKRIISDKTAKLALLINNMDEFVNSAVSKSGNSAKTLTQISNELKTIEFEDMDHDLFNVLKNKMIKINSSIYNEVSTLSNQLKDEQREVAILKKKINTLEESLKDTKKEVAIDFLTGLLTRREFDKELDKFNSEYEHSNKDFTILFLDIDHFKSINDTYGHDAGDSVLKIFAKILQNKVRAGDIVARYGGEEFVILIPNHNKKRITDITDNIQKTMKMNKFIYESVKIKVTFSAGVTIRSLYKSSSEMVKEADKLLYKAKSLGRDRIESKYQI